MKSFRLRCVLTCLIVAAGWAWEGPTRVAEAQQVIRSVGPNAVLTSNWRRFRRWNSWDGPYVGPYWGGGYYGPYSSPYASPPLYYNRIAPGVYYYY